MSTFTDALAPAQKVWRGLGARERRLVGAAGTVVVLALIWMLGVQPAWRTLRSAPAELATLDAQWQLMQRQAAEAERLKAAPALPAHSAAQGVQALQRATEQLGPAARLSVQGERAVLTLTNADGDAILQWLAQIRSGARARAVESNLSRGASGFNGTIVVDLGGRT